MVVLKEKRGVRERKCGDNLIDNETPGIQAGGDKVPHPIFPARNPVQSFCDTLVGCMMASKSLTMSKSKSGSPWSDIIF
jgi:hypothetical protein